MADLELGGLGGKPFSITLPGYDFTLPNDIPLPEMVAASRSLSQMGAVAQGQKDGTLEDIKGYEDEIWKVVESVLTHATPLPPRPVRELMSTTDAIRLVTFLAVQFQGAQNSTPSSVSLTPTAEPSVSETYLAQPLSTQVQSESLSGQGEPPPNAEMEEFAEVIEWPAPERMAR